MHQLGEPGPLLVEAGCAVLLGEASCAALLEVLELVVKRCLAPLARCSAALVSQFLFMMRQANSCTHDGSNPNGYELKLNSHDMT